jgi:hypothetical protein
MSETPPTAPAPAAMPRLRRIEIRNYKALDALDLDFPPPLMAGDPDITVVGSANGVGKTSLLQCCALAHIVATGGDLHGLFERFPQHFQRLIRAGQDVGSITSDHDPGGRNKITLGVYDLKIEPARHLDEIDNPFYFDELFGISPNPLLEDSLLFFHSSRKVVEGAVEMGDALQDKDSSVFSTFKNTIFHILMARANLFEGTKDESALQSLNQLNDLLETFTGGRFDKVLPLGGARVELRITTARNTSFSFDGLSSGQKEIVSILFMIWHMTHAQRGALVLIDEPELHMNAEWHRNFVRQLHKLAPQNQYILATHSAHIFASVDSDRRVMLEPT